MNYNISSSFLPEESASNEFPHIHSISKDKKQKNVKPIAVNLSGTFHIILDTHYDVVERICDEMAWKLQYTDNKSWDLKWTDNGITC